MFSSGSSLHSRSSFSVVVSSMGTQKIWDYQSKHRLFESSKFVVGGPSNRRGSYSIGDPNTLFVDNLPNKAEVPWFKKFFSNFGQVIEASIPNKRSMKTGNKFGFIRYNSSFSVRNAIAQASGIWIGRRNLIVKQAKYGRRNQRESRDDNGGFTKMKDLEKRITINLQPTASDWLWRSAIADLKEVSTPEIILKAFSDLNFKDVQVRSMGGKFMLITFQNVIEVNKQLNVKFNESDEVTLNRLLKLEVEELKRRQSAKPAC